MKREDRWSGSFTQTVGAGAAVLIADLMVGHDRVLGSDFTPAKLPSGLTWTVVIENNAD